MNAIIGMTSIAKSAQNLERKDYALNKIEDASNHLLGVINNILDMSKIEADKLELNPVAFNFGDMIDKVVSFINFRVAEKNQKLVVDIDENIPRILVCDDQRLAQVIANLLSNAVKFTPEHGVITLRAKLSECENDTCAIQFDVTDTGIGISEEQQAGLFKPFHQAQSNTSREYGGTGLGLSITKRIVELMEGSVSVSSALGMGATFTFTVSAVNPGENESDERNSLPGPELCEKPATTGDYSEYSALLVEDVEINREIVLTLLEPTRLNIDCAENGKEAVRMFRERPEVYSIILMDVQMPVMDGFEATRAIRSLPLPNARTIPIIAMTANVFKEDINNCLNAGMNGHIGKPIDLKAVYQVLAQYLEPLHTDRRHEDRRHEDRRHEDRRHEDRRYEDRRREDRRIDNGRCDDSDMRK